MNRPECGYVYDSQHGDTPPRLPIEDYNCPQCCVRDKPDFIALDEDSAG
ncbi:hypothetical protein [Pseudomonas sp.]|nr:hypothetical protein [Pseudomonas sp.]MDP2243401.1 hypothetical protein [Pseudomonas sp.]